MKKQAFIVTVPSLLGLAFLFLLWASMQFKGVTPLDKGYQYFYNDSGVVINCQPLSSDEHIKRVDRLIERAKLNGVESKGLPNVGPNVDGYRVYPRIITGHVSEGKIPIDPYGNRQPYTQKPTGYFIIDVSNDSLYDGLNKKEWLSKLHGFGIKEEPELYKPSIYDEILGRNNPSK